MNNVPELSRPFDSLNKAKDKRVMVELKNGKQYIGQLKSFDTHVNIVLENAEEHMDGQLRRKLGLVFLRGDTITIICPE
jgi:small nuclear ribonucleoprotein